MDILKILVGGLGGLSATGPMTIAMEGLHRRLPADEKYALPPREITTTVLDAAGVPVAENSRLTAGAVMLAHFGYGAAAGVLFGMLIGKRDPSWTAGPLFGAGLWAASYFGLLPAVSLLKSAEQHPPRRSLLMLVVHLVWGMFLGLFVQAVLGERHRVFGALITKSPLPHRDK